MHKDSLEDGVHHILYFILVFLKLQETEQQDTDKKVWFSSRYFISTFYKHSDLLRSTPAFIINNYDENFLGNVCIIFIMVISNYTLSNFFPPCAADEPI